jgi:hypothetical protein
MNTNWFTMIGGGFAAAATLTAGISMSGLTTLVEPPATEAPVAETIYVEQPVLEVAPLGLLPSASPLPPRVIAILPPPGVPSGSVPGAGADASPSEPGAVAEPPALPSIYDEDDEGDDDHGDEDHDEGHDDGGGEYHDEGGEDD